ncbi:MAG: type I DNA topoisomerase [Desulfovibrio sp.]|jgi:DNA topoisomerase-1|nr:type I DNA topoisomerase [Desulfovibrio sp.]
MASELIIVESPAKVKTIRKFLGSRYAVHASVGHVRDLPAKALGVDEANDFAPVYEVISGKEKVVKELQTAASQAETVYLAPDPDREGEAIAWHVAALIRDKAKDIKRIQFNEITARAVKDALEHPRDLNVHLFDAQQARRVLDRLVGYKLSPLLWKTVKRGISAGRVQSVALRIIVDRELAREAFVPKEYWPFKATLQSGDTPFAAEMTKVAGKKANVPNEEKALEIERALLADKFTVSKVDVEENKARRPSPPFITSTLQRAANSHFSYTAKRTMSLAQRLYEGVELGERGVTALITYMRTDSTRIADEALTAVRDYVKEHFGPDHLPEKRRIYKTKAGAQDAHEAIRPVDVAITPEMVKPFLPADQYNVYRLIWTRFVASQMADARYHDTTVTLECADTQWQSKGRRLLFSGYLDVYNWEKEVGVELPPLQEGQHPALVELKKEQKFTQPLPRYSEATLVGELEKQGIGRPSTYASIISTLLERTYVKSVEKQLVPTDLGRAVCGQLMEHFSRLMDVGFTAQMESDLDGVAEGSREWVDLLRDFAEGFNPTLEAAAKNMKNLKGGVPTQVPCPECGSPMLIRFGKAGDFLACSKYPDCKYTSDFTRETDGTVVPVKHVKEPDEKVGTCPKCGKDLVMRKGPGGGRFVGCAGYPECNYTESLSTGVSCPKCGQGTVVEKCTKRGKLFYSCDRYPQCDFAIWNKPVAETCPKCGSPYLILKKVQGEMKEACPNRECGYVKESDGDA